ncbi:hypothetical protein J3P71_03980 [Rhizobium leguminosarum]|uniref:hypothetical protein n=1 Tax=Rhizobium leguminosarum TaxID=384 RepID=UPI001441114E|nr:hypothetical protein [Rhizobium leguminosarum]MBY5841423.1 hypothetical protein [Rhizobium leguminosarum]NKM81418.1 hypothetical protein [Rhizobium leguminosarum bv. viciae]QSZ08946.1 hypothetical protein J3P71_03980 [Rhizobium leguminosarum]
MLLGWPVEHWAIAIAVVLMLFVGNKIAKRLERTKTLRRLEKVMEIARRDLEKRRSELELNRPEYAALRDSTKSSIKERLAALEDLDDLHKKLSDRSIPVDEVDRWAWGRYVEVFMPGRVN